jgi:hypothetical protein
MRMVLFALGQFLTTVNKDNDDKDAKPECDAYEYSELHFRPQFKLRP